MSGIVGIVDYRHPPQQEHVRMLSAKVADRGRDAKYFFAMQAACFGYRKKQYHANQESISRVGDWVLMIDSHDQIDQKIIELWKKNNIECLTSIKGSFALSAWNSWMPVPNRAAMATSSTLAASHSGQPKSSGSIKAGLHGDLSQTQYVLTTACLRCRMALVQTQMTRGTRGTGW